MKNTKEVKLTNKIKEIGPKLKWMLFSELQELKLTSDYIDLICPDPKNKKISATQKLDELVRESLIKEFSPEIQNTKSFELLVDAVSNNLKKKMMN